MNLKKWMKHAVVYKQRCIDNILEHNDWLMKTQNAIPSHIHATRKFKYIMQRSNSKYINRSSEC